MTDTKMQNAQKNRAKGAIVITESMLTIGGLVISIILLVVLFSAIFGHQSRSVEDTGLIAIGRSLGQTLDRVSAAASSIKTTYNISSGLNLNISIGFKQVDIVFINGSRVRTATTPLTGNLKIDRPYIFSNPRQLCIVKNRADNKIYISDRECKCNLLDDVCDPACIIENKCDPACGSSQPNDVCDPRCVKQGDSTCDPDCYRNQSDMVVDMDCIKSGDYICDVDANEIEKGICDTDCVMNGTDGMCDLDCAKQQKADGICDADCEPDSKCNNRCDPDCGEANGVCDPDCGSDPDCTICAREGESCSEKPCCTRTLCGANASQEYLTCCAGTKLCIDLNKTSCCGNAACEINPYAPEPATSTSSMVWARWNLSSKPKTWENFYTCSQDCGDFDKQSSCGDSSGCSCATRASPGTFTSSPCVTGTTGPDNPGRLVWRENVIQVCSDAAITYLNRRGWDINEVVKDIQSSLPQGFAFDNSRYTIIPCSVQNASMTILGNEEYSRTDYCCCSTNNCALAPPGSPTKGEVCKVMPECTGVGFCVDHATAMLTVLRTLGVPKDNVYAFFMIGSSPGCSRHAVVAYKCDTALAKNLVIDGCENGEWYVVDATWHKVTKLSAYPCTRMCSWWNDAGLYNETSNTGNAFPSGLSCDPAGWDLSNSECRKQGILCNPQEGW